MVFSCKCKTHAHLFLACSLVGAEFTRLAVLTFYPGNQRLTITQTAKGLNDQNYLSVDTHLEGSVPAVPAGASVQMDPYSEIYHYYPSRELPAEVERVPDTLFLEPGPQVCTLTPLSLPPPPPSGHVQLDARVHRRVGRERRSQVQLSAPAEHHVPPLQARGGGGRGRNATAQRGTHLCHVREGGARPPIRHHQQDRPRRRWVKIGKYQSNVCR